MHTQQGSDAWLLLSPLPIPGKLFTNMQHPTAVGEQQHRLPRRQASKHTACGISTPPWPLTGQWAAYSVRAHQMARHRIIHDAMC